DRRSLLPEKCIAGVTLLIKIQLTVLIMILARARCDAGIYASRKGEVSSGIGDIGAVLNHVHRPIGVVDNRIGGAVHVRGRFVDIRLQGMDGENIAVIGRATSRYFGY